MCASSTAKFYTQIQVGIPGPDTFTRCLAGRQLAFLIRQLDYKHLASILPLTLPYVLATVKDLSTQVQCYGLHALHHIATGAVHQHAWCRKCSCLQALQRLICTPSHILMPAAV